MNINKEFLVLLLSLLSFNAYSKFMVEPRLLLTQGSSEVSNQKNNFSAQAAGLNLGYVGQYFMAGVALEKGVYRFNSNLATTDHKIFNGGGVGTYLGFHFWNKIRIMTTYLNSSLEPRDDTSFRFFGQYVSFSLSYRLWRGLLINAQSFSNFYTQIENDQTGKTSGLSRNIKTTGSTLSLSYIFSF